MAEVKGIPKTERIWVRYTTAKGEVYLTTSKESDRSMYYLYKMDGDKAVKLGKNKSSLELERQFIKN